MLEVDLRSRIGLKRVLCAPLLFVLLVIASVTSVHASVTVQAIIDQDIHVAFDLENINSTIYLKIKNENLITESTLPNAILDGLEQQNLSRVDVFTQPIVFNDSASSIYIAFSLTGSDILNSTVSTKSMTRTCHARTDWRKFEVNITNGFSLDFAEHFSEPVERWQRINYTLDAETHPAYYYASADSNTIDPACYFILPATATNLQARGDILTFQLPHTLSFGDSLLNSPFLILGALIIINIAFFLYRRVKK